MEWVSDVSVGDWLRERVDDPWRGTMHDMVPRGFAAYARVFHPATRSKPVGRDWPPLPQDKHRREWERFADARPEIETRPARWQDAADAFGTTMHPLAQWAALVRSRGGEWNPSDWQHATSPDGWQFDAPSEGDLDADVLAAVMTHLVGEGSCDGYAALWEGWGGVVGHLGTGPSRTLLAFDGDAPQHPDDPAAPRYVSMLEASGFDAFNRPFATETWQPGILSDEVSQGARLTLPNRDHVLFRGDLSRFADPRWPAAVPWADQELAAAGFAQYAQSPSLVWPADRSWVLVTEIDADSTIVGGPASVVERVCADPAIEALPVAAGSSLQWDADEVNR